MKKMSVSQNECWITLGDRAGSRLEAAPTGPLGHEYRFLNHTGEEFGRLRLRGLRGASFAAEELTAEILRQGALRLRYRMTCAGEEILTAGPERPLGGTYRIETRRSSYRSRPGFLKREVVLWLAGDNPEDVRYESVEAARIDGSLTGRGLSVRMADPEHLPATVFAVYQLLSLQRRIHTAGSGRTI